MEKVSDGGAVSEHGKGAKREECGASKRTRAAGPASRDTAEAAGEQSFFYHENLSTNRPSFYQCMRKNFHGFAEVLNRQYVQASYLKHGLDQGSLSSALQSGDMFMLQPGKRLMNGGQADRLVLDSDRWGCTCIG